MELNRLIFCGMVVFAVAEGQRRFEFEDMFSTLPRSASVSWLRDGISYSFRDGDNVLVQELASPLPSPSVIMSAEVLPGDAQNFFAYSTSYDQRYVSLATNRTNIWCSSYTADYRVFDGLTQQTDYLTTADDKTVPQMSATWSPTDYKVAFVRDNNVFVRDVSSGEPETAVTTDGSDEITYGPAQWMYDPMDEEYKNEHGPVFYTFYWSPDSRHLAFLKSDRTDVEVFKFMYYTYDRYPQPVNLKYPMPSEPNPKIEVAIHDTVTGCMQYVDVGGIIGVADILIIDMFWVDSETFAIRAQDRLQQHHRLLYVSLPVVCIHERTLSKLDVRIVYERLDSRWAIRDAPFRSIPGTSLVFDIDDNNGYRHISIVDTALGADPVQQFITSGSWEVTSIAGFNAETSTIFFFSTEINPLERHLYSIQTDGSQKTLLTTMNGWHTASFSPTGEFYVENFQGYAHDLTQVPTSTIRSTSNSEFIPIVLEDNADIRAALMEMDLPKYEFLQIPNPADPLNRPLNTKLIFPPDYDVSKQYPVLVYIYGGPDSQTVSLRHDLVGSLQEHMDLYLASHGYIIATVDCRGTSAQGVEFMKSIYLNLGRYETQDFLMFGRYLRDRFNPSSLGIWGKSYGGYMTLKVMQQDVDQVYDSGILLAPVTEWIYYNTGYTERYMSFPELNEAGYQESAVLGNIQNLENHEMLIIHGTGDDNVHFHHCVLLFEELINAEIMFDSIVYPNDDHVLDRRRHMNRYIEKWLKLYLP